jgi:hypothetical protein
MKDLFYPDQDINDIIESEEEAFYKGGVGSGKRGHKTPKEALSDRLSAKGIPKEKHWMYTDSKYKHQAMENTKESDDAHQAKQRFRDQLKSPVKINKSQSDINDLVEELIKG